MRIIVAALLMLTLSCGSPGDGGTGGGGGSSGGGSGTNLACADICFTGCCDNSGQCLSGDSDDACGDHASACTKCGATSECGLSALGDQECVPKCSAANCAGCCFGGACQTGTTNAACGKNGAACAACGGAFVCKSDQTCGVDDASTWVVQATGASITSTNNGSSWDGDGSPPDVYVASTCGTDAGAAYTNTTPFVESYTPTWTSGGCTATAAALKQHGFQWQYFDDDIGPDDTVTGGFTFTLTDADFQAGALSFGASGGASSMSFSLTKQ